MRYGTTIVLISVMAAGSGLAAAACAYSGGPPSLAAFAAQGRTYIENLRPCRLYQSMPPNPRLGTFTAPLAAYCAPALPLLPAARPASISIAAGAYPWLSPGLRIDLALQYAGPNRTTSVIVVQGARLLSYSGTGGPGRAATITVDAPPADLRKLQLAARLGSLQPVPAVRRRPVRSKAAERLPIRTECGSLHVDGRSYTVRCDGRLALKGAP